MLRRAVVVGVICAGAVAHADVTQKLDGGAVVDWSRGVITARGIGPADRHAPAPAVARDAARVRAEAAAREVLAAAAKKLPGVPRVIGSGGDPAAGSPAAGDLADAALAQAVARATVATMDVGTDGSVTVELALPVEAVRVAIAGPRRAEPQPGAAPPVVIVDASHLKTKVKPEVGFAIGAWTGPVLFVDAPLADGDPRAGEHPVKVTATKAAARTLTIDGDAPAAGALVVVVIGGSS